MSSEATLGKREHGLLIGDGFLLTAGLMSVGVTLMFGVMALPGVVEGPTLLTSAGSSLILLASGVGGVVATWLLHGRRIDVAAVVGGLIGPAAGGLLVPLAAGLSFLLGYPAKLVSSSEFAGPVAMLVLVSIGLLVLTVWLLIDGLRDLAPAKREHSGLDIARIAATIAFVGLAAVCVFLMFAQPGPEQGEAIIWAMAGGGVGAGSIAGADLATWLWARQRKSSGSALAGA